MNMDENKRPKKKECTKLNRGLVIRCRKHRESNLVVMETQQSSRVILPLSRVVFGIILICSQKDSQGGRGS